MGLAGRAPAIAGRGGGPGARGWHGVPQGDRGCLLHMVACWFAAVWSSGPSGGHVHGRAA